MKIRYQICNLFVLTLLFLFVQAAKLDEKPLHSGVRETTEQLCVQGDPPGAEFFSGHTCLPEISLPSCRSGVPVFSVFDILPVPWSCTCPGLKFNRRTFSGLSPPVAAF
jgi:hypothetical protein